MSELKEKIEPNQNELSKVEIVPTHIFEVSKVCISHEPIEESKVEIEPKQIELSKVEINPKQNVFLSDK